MIELHLVSALEKILPNQTPLAASSLLHLAANETGSIQLAFQTTDPSDYSEIHISAPAEVQIRAYQVGLTPANTPAPTDPDGAYLVHAPTLMPDILRPLGEANGQLSIIVKTKHQGWNTIWVDLTAPAGTHPIHFSASPVFQIGRDIQQKPREPQQPIWETDLSLVVAELPLPTAKLTSTQWFHTDSLAAYHQVEIWSEAHWAIIDNHLASAARMGVNCVLTPLWTPPLDTAVGTYRKTTQLLEITQTGEELDIDFTKAKRWLELLAKHGLTDVEVPHLFTQWGAQATPRFEVKDASGNRSYLFGWDEAATSENYRAFLKQLLPQVRAFLAEKLGENHVWYHISDEPNGEQLEAYMKAKAQVSDLLAGAQVIDALSEPEFIEAVNIPVVATDAVEGFRAAGVEPQWVYNCVAQSRAVANRFIAQTGTRHREIGFQLYKGRASGYLHWAFNFYNSQYSLEYIDPYQDTAAGGGFISGDSFVVYPTEDGNVLESLRHRLLRAAMNDLALCQSIEEKVGRQAVLDAIDPSGELNYDHGYSSSQDLEDARQRLLALL